MGLLGILPGKKELIARIIRELADGANDQIDTEEERQAIAEYINEKLDVPFLTEEEEQKALEAGLEKLHDALVHIENIFRK